MKQTKQLILFLIIIAPLKLWAQNIVATIDNTTILTGDTCYLAYTANVELAQQTSTLKMPKGIKILETKSNFDTVTNNWIYTFKLLALKVGEYNLPILNAGNIKSNPIHLSIIEIKNTSSTSNYKEESNTRMQEAQINTYNGKDVFGKCEFANKNYIKGQQINIAFFVYSKYPANINDYMPPAFTNCWVEKLEEIDPLAEPQKQTINGQEYFKYKIAAYALFAIKETPISLSKATAFVETSVAVAPKNTADALSNKLGLQTVEKKGFNLNFENATINIKPFAQQNVQCQTSLVGNYTLERKITKLPNDVVQVLYVINGNGNLKFCADINVSFNDKWIVDYTSVKDTAWIANNTLQNRKTLFYNLMPKAKGNLLFSESGIAFIHQNTLQCRQLKCADTLLQINTTNVLSNDSLALNKSNTGMAYFFKKHIIYNKQFWIIFFSIFTLGALITFLKKQKIQKAKEEKKQEHIATQTSLIEAIDINGLSNAEAISKIKNQYVSFLKQNFSFQNFDIVTIQNLPITEQQKQPILNFLQKANAVLYGNDNNVDVHELKKNVIQSITSLVV